MSGEAFQDFFNQVMGYGQPGFQSITPWGNWGDGGNDGWIPSNGHYFQLYAPRPTTTLSANDAVKKAVDDFKKIPVKWKNVRKYFFVLNDRFKGIPGPVASALQTLQINHSLEEARGWGCMDLEQVFMSLGDNHRMAIVGAVPSCSFSYIDPTAVSGILTALANREDEVIPLLRETAPDFDEKITFNGLTSPVSDFLRFYSRHTTIVDEFLDSRDVGLRQSVATEVRNLYQQCKGILSVGEEDAGNTRYVWMIEHLIPEGIRMLRQAHTIKAYRAAAHILMAKYFETCDAYDHPNSSTST